MAGFTVTSVTADQIEDQATQNLIDVYDITFTVDPSPSQYTVQVPTSGDPVSAAATAMQAITDQVNAIKAL